MKTTIQKAALRGATSLTAFALLCGTAHAQDAAPQKSEEAASDDSNVIIVTGSLLRRTDAETASPVTVISADNFEQRGINTAAEALQRLSANGSGTISEGWNNGNNFAAGANAISLRGLTVQNTLTIVDGMRMAMYPVADDGHRNFVDLNSIPDAVIDRIEVVKDGASSTYGAAGSRNVKSAFYDISAPIIDQVELSASGRYDKYSSGQSNFSPKFGIKIKPIEQVLLRGTWSKGFRIPSFNEAYGLPTTGYANFKIDCTTYAAYCASHDNNNYVSAAYNIGRTGTGNPDLKPEKSTSYTFGAVFEPMRNVSFTVDYFRTKIKGIIGGVSAEDQDAALDAYLRTGATNAVTGVTIRPLNPDPDNLTAIANPGFIEYSYNNSDSQVVEGIDFGANISYDFGPVTWTSNLDASYLIKYELTRATGTKERYDGSLSPCDYTSCSGSPKWRGSWQNTFTMGKVSLTGTAYYTHGYDLASVDYSGVKGDCAASVGASVVEYDDGTPVKCKVGAQWNFDIAANVQVSDNFSIYANILNAFAIKPKFDPSAAYSIFNYNPAWGQANMVGRYFRLGAKVDF